MIGSDTADAIHKTLSLGKVAIIFEDIKELELASLDVGHTATPTNKRAVVTSLILRFVKKKKKLDQGSIGSSPRHGIGPPSKKNIRNSNDPTFVLGLSEFEEIVGYTCLLLERL